jgi:flagellin
MKLLDGSLDGSASVSNAGPKFGVYDTDLQGFVTSDVAGVKIASNTTATAGGESAIWDNKGTVLTLNLAANTTYTEAELDNLIKNAKQEDSSASNTPAHVELNLNNGTYTAAGNTTGTVTVAGQKSATANAVELAASGGYVGANEISITANKYGADNDITILIKFDAEKGDEKFELGTAATYETDGSLKTTGQYELHLATGTEYTEGDIEKLLATQGFSATVEFSGPDPDEANTLFVTTPKAASTTVALTGGAGLGDTDAYLGQKKYDVKSAGEGVILQVGANFGQTISFGIGNMGLDWWFC